MLLTYWLFHLVFTLPPTLLLYALLRPILSIGDRFRFFFLSTVAVLYSLPWDSYIIHHKAWTYAHWAVTATIFKVPIEEVFFFSIQSILTGYLYTLFTFPLLPALYILPTSNSLANRHPAIWSFLRWSPSLLFAALALYSWKTCQPATHSFYITCIGFWAMPVCCLLWSIAGDHILQRPKSSIIWPIMIPTVYLCWADVVALRRGVWSISAPTSLGIFVWPDLPIEEALFFFVTNLILVFGLAAMEKTEAIADTWPELLSSNLNLQQDPPHHVFSFQHFTKLCKMVKLSFNLSKTLTQLRPGLIDRPSQLARTLDVLRTASKSFYSASLVFSNFRAGRAKFVILYGFCRETDDLIDNAVDLATARHNVSLCRDFLNLLWPDQKKSNIKKNDDNDKYLSSEKLESSSGLAEREDHSAFETRLRRFVNERVPLHARPTFILFASLRSCLSRGPFDELINGYAYDALEYQSQTIETDEDLLKYSRWVAGSVGEMCVELMWSVEGNPPPFTNKKEILQAANNMGVALQLVNIARDIREDAFKHSRVYLPVDWFKKSQGGTLTLEHLDLLRSGSAGKGKLDRFPYAIAANKLLKLAASYRSVSTSAIEQLPKSFRPGVRAATEVYLAIGNKLSIAIGSADWNGQRIFLSHFQRSVVVAREIWGLPRN